MLLARELSDASTPYRIGLADVQSVLYTTAIGCLLLFLCKKRVS